MLDEHTPRGPRRPLPPGAGVTSITRQAPAKINLYLEVLGRRPDGFHELITILQTLELCDEIGIALRPARNPDDVTLSLELPPGFGATIPTGADNLVVRAARALLHAAGLTGETGVELALTKCIPPGGGLGGGSSDAAAVLTGLNQLLGQPCDAAALSRLAAELGSDVPFFLTGGTALCRGRGEIVQALESPAPFPVTLLLPPFGVSTPSVYSALGAGRVAAGATQRTDPSLVHMRVPELEALFRNDLEPAARHVEARLTPLLDEPRVHLSGSGSTLFLFGVPSDAVRAECRRNSMRIVETQSKNR